MTTEPTPHAIHVPDKGAPGCLLAILGMGYIVYVVLVIKFCAWVFK